LTFWRVREELSKADRLRRSYYELLRDELDHFLLKYALIDSYHKFLQTGATFPFVEKRELKPRARIPDVEYGAQNTFLVIFVDYALMIQRDPSTKSKNRYGLSHFHVRIDWPITDAAEDLARNLRYISKDIYERGDKYAEDIQKKFFEYYCQPVMVGGRRTAAIVAAQYLKRLPCISTIYAGSSESRALIRISERGVSKAVLMKFSAEELEQVGRENGLSLRTIKRNYVVKNNGRGKDCVCIFQATYDYTIHSRPPEDGKLREIKSDLSWQSVGGQHILPLPGVWKYPPLSFNVIYS
jgi:hypothetical protein